jgi:hypothetical protein
MERTTLHFGRAALFVGIIAVSAFFWDSPVLLPFKLLAVAGHETGHALAALLVGGTVDRISVSPNEAGQCLSRIPDGFFGRVVVSSAGYVGSALISALLLLLTFRFNARRAMLGAACVWLTLMGIFYARDGFTLAFCLVMALLFGLGAKWLPAGAVGAVNLFLASFTSLYALLDLKDDLWNPAVRAQSDAAILASSTFVPAVVWAALWTLMSVALLALGAWYALRDHPAALPGPKKPARPSTV